MRYPHCVLRWFKPELWLTHDGLEPFNGRYEVTVRNLANGGTDLYQGLMSAGSYESLFIRTLTPVRMTAGTRLHVSCRLFNAKDESVHENDYLFASNEDAAPFGAEMPALIQGLFERD